MQTIPLGSSPPVAPAAPVMAAYTPADPARAGQATGQTTGPSGAAFDVVLSAASQSDAIAAVQAQYDVTNITPAQVDQMFDDLVAAGHPLNQDLLMLSTMGGRFRSHLATITGTPPDLNRPANLIQTATDQLTMARNSGSGTEGWEQLISFLDTLSSTPPTTASAARTSAAQDHAAMLRFTAQGSRA